jgi:2-polyprenyl-3-methyl-5-hydroxy-6-metoxy-1,4-benzoquinol methylase
METHSLNPAWLMEEFVAYERTFALRTAIELDLFTRIGRGVNTIPALAEATGASERGLRVLCDNLAIRQHLVKERNRYRLTLNSRVYLSKDSPAWFGSAIQFLAGDTYIEAFSDLLRSVKRGRGRSRKTNWPDFARHMSPLAPAIAEFMAKAMNVDSAGPIRILDVAAGHGLYGLALAARNPEAEIYALDAPQVLRVAAKNARKAGVSKRFHRIPGDAFKVGFARPYDLVIAGNIAHHLEPGANIELFRKCRAALKPKGKLVVLDFVVNDDRVSPPAEAGFAIHLFATGSCDVYTFREYQGMLRAAGFRGIRRGKPGSYGSWMIVASL